MERLVVFDLGGVMVRVNFLWARAMTRAGLEPTPSSHSDLHDCPEFLLFQAGRIGQTEYLSALTAFLGVEDAQQALLAHNGILDRPYEGTSKLVESLHAAGVATACLSNTNEPHWKIMSEPNGLTPAIAALQSAFLSHELRLEKPDPAIYQAVEEATGRAPGDICFFDDSPQNVQAALERGWNALRIDAAGDPPGQIRIALKREGIG